jgi:hypothetical protein
MLPLHACPTEPLQDVVESVADASAAESATEPLHAVGDLVAAGAASTKTSCLCVQV